MLFAGSESTAGESAEGLLAGLTVDGLVEAADGVAAEVFAAPGFAEDDADAAFGEGSEADASVGAGDCGAAEEAD